MKKLLFLVIFSLMLSNPLVIAQRKTIHVTPDNAKIFVDGSEVGNGSYTIKFDHHTDFFVLKFTAPGYITKQVKLMKNNPNKTIAYKLAKDEFYYNSVGPNGGANGEEGIDLANKWFEVSVRKDLSEEQVWKRLMSIATKNFENIEVRDKSAGWIRTAWAKSYYPSQVVRTRLEIKFNTDNDEELTYKVKVYSELCEDIELAGDANNFVKSDRIMNKYVDLINELQNKLN